MERDDFIFYTNFIESRGYEIDKDFVNGGCIGKFRFRDGDWRIGKKVYETQLECQKKTVTAIYNMIKDK